MIEILPAHLARGVQLVGVDDADQRAFPSLILLAFQSPLPESASRLRGMWLGGSVGVTAPPGMLLDVVSECLPPVQAPSSRSIPPGGCPECGATSPSRVVTVGGRPICPEHLADLWTRSRPAHGLRPVEETCPFCQETTSLWWEGGGEPLCAPCFFRNILAEQPTPRWIWIGGTPLAPGQMEDWRLFLEAWRRIESCERCGSRSIRIRRLLLDFPRAQGPLYPLWEIRRGDMTAEEELRRGKQLLAYTEGFLKVTVECPQCGYLEREFTGLDRPFPSTLPWPHLASPIVL